MNRDTLLQSDVGALRQRIEYLEGQGALERKWRQDSDARLREIRQLVDKAQASTRHPVDLNYIALLKDDWERIVGLVNRLA